MKNIDIILICSKSEYLNLIFKYTKKKQSYISSLISKLYFLKLIPNPILLTEESPILNKLKIHFTRNNIQNILSINNKKKLNTLLKSDISLFINFEKKNNKILSDLKLVIDLLINSNIQAIQEINRNYSLYKNKFLSDFFKNTQISELNDLLDLSSIDQITNFKLNKYLKIYFEKNTNLKSKINSENISEKNLHEFNSKNKSFTLNFENSPYLIAEIGGNHEGNFDYAMNLTNLAINTKSLNCIKFQLYSGSSLVSKYEDQNRFDHFKKFELKKEEHIKLAELCINNKIHYSASVWSLKILNWIDKYLLFYKVGSGDLTCWPLLEEFAKRGKPIILSTGLSDLADVTQSVNFIKSINPKYNNRGMIGIMQCTSMYPIKHGDVNLNVLHTFNDYFDVPIGYSDHTVDIKALIYASAIGAKFLEFHFTDEKNNRKFRDHLVSLTPDDVINLKKELKILKNIKGKYDKTPQKIELINKHETSFRRAIYLNKKINKGETITHKDIVFLRPLRGIDSRDYRLVINSLANEDLLPYRALKFHNNTIKLLKS